MAALAMSPKTKSWTKSRPRANTNWQHLSVSEVDDGKRWRIIWDTVLRSENQVRNTAVEKTKSNALDRARHMLRMGFVVYEIQDPSGGVVLDESTIRTQLSEAPPTQ
jgi:hypothetical protein